jgi:hypothetical protein
VPGLYSQNALWLIMFFLCKCICLVDVWLEMELFAVSTYVKSGSFGND